MRKNVEAIANKTSRMSLVRTGANKTFSPSVSQERPIPAREKPARDAESSQHLRYDGDSRATARIATTRVTEREATEAKANAHANERTITRSDAHQTQSPHQRDTPAARTATNKPAQELRHARWLRRKV